MLGALLRACSRGRPANATPPLPSAALRFQPPQLHLQVHEWLADTLPAGARVGIDPLVHTIEAAEKLRRRLRAAGKELVALAPGENPVDAVWGAARPAAPDVSLGRCCGASWRRALWVVGGLGMAACTTVCRPVAILSMPRPAPPRPQAPLRVHPAEWAGQSVADKLGAMRQQMAEVGAGALLVTMLGGPGAGCLA